MTEQINCPFCGNLIDRDAIKCENCDKPLFVEQQALNNNSSIPCPFCGKRAR